ncbi:MAG: hypothetical protein ABI222_00290 [Opitutaceae bacterium]
MTFSPRIFLCLVLALLCGPAVARAAGDERFSSTLTAEEHDRAGLGQLSADNLAIIDGLVRQDDAASKFKNNEVDGTQFSQRHTPRERELAGLDLLNPAQLATLDKLIGQRYVVYPAAARDFAATMPSVAAPLVGVKPTLSTDKLEIHGEISYTQGWSKGGSYSGGDILLTYADPAGRYAIAVGYGEYRGKGTLASPGFYPGYGYGPYRTYSDRFNTFR